MAVAAINCGQSSRKTILECREDADCNDPDRPYCLASGDRCVGCLDQAQCSCHETCLENNCVAVGALVPADSINAHGNWVGTPGQENYAFVGFCESSGDCRIGEVCNPFTKSCKLPPDPDYSCQNDPRECPPGLECDITTELCLPAAMCLTDANCCGMAEFRCSTDDPEVPGLCFMRECVPPDPVVSACPFEPSQSDDCGEGTFCSPSGVCVECVCDADCPTVALPKCDVTGGECVRIGFCRAPTDCPQDNSCDRLTNECAPYCADSEGCVYGESCDIFDHVCRCAQDTFESNETQPTARVMPLPERGGAAVFVNATMCDGDTDWYKFDLDRGDRLQILGTSESSLEADIRAFAPDGSTNIGDGLILGGGYARELDFTADIAGTYFIVVNEAFSTGDYRLEIVRSLGLICDEGGQNDTVGAASFLNPPAGPVSPGCTLVSGDLTGSHVITCLGTMRTCEDDLDFYLIHAPQGSEVNVLVNNFAGEDIEVTLYGPFELGETPNDTRLVDSSTTSSSSERVNAVTRPQTLYVMRIHEDRGDPTPYNIRLEIAPPGGVVCAEDAYDAATTSEPFDDDGFNDRGTEPSGIALLPMMPQDLSLSMCVGDQDWFVLGNDSGGAGLAGFDPGQRVAVSITDASIAVANLLVYVGASVLAVTEAVDQGRSGTQSVQLPTHGDLIYVAVVPTVSVAAAVEYTLHLELETPPACNLDTLGDLAVDNRNDLPTQATPLEAPPWPATAADGSYTYPNAEGGKLSACVGDDDWYRIDTQEYTALDVRVTYPIGSGELGLAVFNSTVVSATTVPGVPPTMGRLGISISEGEAGQVVRVEPGTDSIYIMVYNRGDWPVTTYELSVAMTPVGCIDDGLEENDSGATATPVELALSATHVGREDAFIDGLQACDTDQDWFSVHLQAEDRVEAVVNYDPSQGNTNLFLYRPGGSGTSLDADFDSGNTGIMTVEYEVPASANEGDYLIKVDPGTSGGNHNVYDLSVFVYRSCVDDRYGPATFTTPTPVTLPGGLIQYGAMQLCNNEDWFAVTSTTNTSVSVCTRFDHDVADLDIQVFDEHADPATITAVADSLTKKDFEEVILNTIAGTTHWIRVFLDVRSSGDIIYGLWIQPDGLGCREICEDNVINGDESDRDCGGSCTGCDDGFACNLDTDCSSNNCENGVCR
ncbi:MAG: hypothetical protein A2289_17890 [Deltaproteobacteria bacterium RIFOXYA12_FULL_58_15]|nr:MAG: hypothetical protein A2289_17890 [Deltaproteobacteria bacterium RIFOXYA12_FULL_58_15]OGR09050.1 MAG: hypothetical protein A2341_25800 [Deltaproteobacteria bacterium RIFOXYB12_FULL_58_9]